MAEDVKQGVWRRRRDVIVIGVVAVSFIVLTIIETRLPQLSRSVSPGSSITFFLLINLNVILLILLIFLVVRNLVKLVTERRRGTFGAGLQTKLVLSFVLLTALPTTMLFIIAQGFLDTAIESWFSSRVEKSLDSAKKIVEAYYQQAGNQTILHARQLGRQLQEHAYLTAPRDEVAEFIELKRTEWNLDAIEVIVGHESIAVAAKNRKTRRERLSSPEQRSLLIDGRDLVRTVGDDSGDVIQAGVPIRGTDGTVLAAVVAEMRVPRSLTRAALNSARAYQEFRQLRVLEQPIENSYTLTFSLITLVVVFTATWLGFYLARNITEPIEQLGAGMRNVAQGRLDYRAEVIGDREVASLIDNFNQMATELQTTHSALDERRRYIESILANITAGVVSIDEQGKIVTMNPAAGGMFGMNPDGVQGRAWQEVFDRSALKPVEDLLARLRETRRDRAEGEVTLTGGARELTAWVTATTFEEDEPGKGGILLFFEDVSHLQRMERMEVWREVARRIAHEIKNPLTPIQLSAQRLSKRYESVLQGEDREILDECTRTIVGQVEQLKRLVNEFQNFARLPAVELAPGDLNQVASEALVLYREGHRDIAFELRADPTLPAVEFDRSAITRAIINMLDNAVAACESAAIAEPRVDLKTGYDPRAGVVQLEVADNGCGMTPDVKARAFEPYFSTKLDGSGLGLAIVSATAADHHAYVRIADNQPRGTRVIIEFPMRRAAPLRAAARA